MNVIGLPLRIRILFVLLGNGIFIVFKYNHFKLIKSLQYLYATDPLRMHRSVYCTV